MIKYYINFLLGSKGTYTLISQAMKDDNMSDIVTVYKLKAVPTKIKKAIDIVYIKEVF